MNFIPKPYTKEQITVRFAHKKLAEIDKLASKYELSRNEFINQCVDFALSNMVKEQQIDKEKK